MSWHARCDKCGTETTIDQERRVAVPGGTVSVRPDGWYACDACLADGLTEIAKTLKTAPQPAG